MIKKLVLFFALSLTLFATEYERIIVLDPAVVETIYMLGGEDRIEAIAHSTMTPIEPADKTKKLPNVGTLLKPSLELIMAHKPDMVIAGKFHGKILKSFETFGVPYTTFEAKTLDDMLNNILSIGEMVGRQDEAKALYEISSNKLNRVKKGLEKKPLNLKGTFIYNSTPLIAFSGKSIQHEILLSLGVEDIAAGVVGQRPILSPEYILEENPDFLIGIMGIKSKEDLIRSNEYLLKTKAGRKKNIHILQSNRILRISPHIVSEIEKIYEFLNSLN